MALPQDGQNANGLTKVTEVPTGKELIFVDPTTNEGGIITLEDLTTQILNKLTSKIFTLDQGNITLIEALNKLNSNTSKVVNVTKLDYNTDFHKIPDGIYSFNINTSNETDSNLGLPPMVLSDGILISKTYSYYQTLVCIGIGGIAVAQNNLQTGKFEKSWDLYIRSNS